MKKILLSVLLLFPYYFPSVAFSAGWTDAQLKANLQVPSGSTYLSCHKDPSGVYSVQGNAYTTNANWNTAAGQDNVRIGFFATNNIYTNAQGWRESKGATAVNIYKTLTFQYVYGGVTYNYSIPPGAYPSATPTTSYRHQLGHAYANAPSTGLAGNIRLASYSLYYSVAGGPMNYDMGYLKVTAILPNGLPANFYLDCYK